MSATINTSFSRGPGGCMPAPEKANTKFKAMLTGAKSASPVKQAQPASQADQVARARPIQNGAAGVQAPAPELQPAPVGPGTLLDLRA